MTKTFKEIMSAFNGEVVATVELGNGLSLEASCWTDDPDVENLPASFDVRASWGDGNINDPHDELYISLQQLNDEITRKVGGNWCYNGSSQSFEQV